MVDIESKQVYEALDRVMDACKQWKFAIDNGCTLREFCDYYDELREATDEFLSLVNDFSSQEMLKDIPDFF